MWDRTVCVCLSMCCYAITCNLHAYKRLVCIDSDTRGGFSCLTGKIIHRLQDPIQATRILILLSVECEVDYRD